VKTPGENVPSFKNTKAILGIRLDRQLSTSKQKVWRGIPFIGTNKKKKQWMTKAILAIESELRSLFPTEGDETQTGCFPQSLTALLTRLEGFDDSLDWIAIDGVDVEYVQKGNEGFLVEIREELV